MNATNSIDCKDISIPVPWGHIAGRWYGNRNRRPILTLHGWLDNMGSFDKLIPLLPSHVGFLCIDFPGHGRSSKYPIGVNYHVIDYVHIILRVMKEYSWKKVSLMGHSMGSLVIFIYASLYPSTVDMIISIDFVKQLFYVPDSTIQLFRVGVENRFKVDEDLKNIENNEPQSHPYGILELILHKGSGKSVELENCKYILNRNITKSALYPDQYYFSRDARLKYYMTFFANEEVIIEMAKRIKNVPYILLKGKNSIFVNESSDDVIGILRQNCLHFELHEIDGTHHVHLNNAEGVARCLSPFLNRFYPVALNAWSIYNGSENKSTKRINKL